MTTAIEDPIEVPMPSRRRQIEVTVDEWVTMLMARRFHVLGGIVDLPRLSRYSQLVRLLIQNHALPERVVPEMWATDYQYWCREIMQFDATASV